MEIEKREAEVISIMMSLYDRDSYMELFEKRKKEEGREEEKVSNIRALMERLKWSAETAMDALAVPAEEREKYALKLKETETTGSYSAEG